MRKSEFTFLRCLSETEICCRTSLGGVESLIEWRRMSDNTVGPELLRISVGVEAFEDLRDDLVNGFESLAAEK